MATITAGYVKAGREGADVTLGDSDAKANFAMEDFSATALTDTSALYLGVSASPMAKVTVGLDYGTTSDVDGTTAEKEKLSETRLKVAYAMSSNFNVSGFLTKLSDNDSTSKDTKKSRVEMKYTF
jgi:hypothetical protein